MNDSDSLRLTERFVAGTNLPPSVRRARLAAGILLLLSMVGAVASTYWMLERELQTTLEGKLSTLLRANVHAAEQWLDEQGELAGRLCEQPMIAQSTAQVVHGAPEAREEAAAELAAHLQPLYETRLIVGHLVLDGEGRVSWPTHVATQTSPGESVLVLETASALHEQGVVVIVPPRHTDDVWQGRVAALAAVGSKSNPPAILVLLVDPQHLSRGLQIANWGRSGETFAFDGSGAFITEPRFGTKLRETGSWPSTGRAFVPRVAVPSAPSEQDSALAGGMLTFMAQEATQGRSGVNVKGYISYLGSPVVGAWHWLAPYNFGIATEAALDEAHASVSMLRTALFSLVALLGLSLLGFIALGRWTLHVREESVLVTQRLGRLARAIQPLSAALEHDPSAVLLVDAEGVVVYGNPASRELLGITGPIIGQRAEQVFANLHPELESALDSGQDSIVVRAHEDEGETVLVSTRDLHIDGKPHYLYMLRTVTRQVRRQELEHWRKLIRVLSHELNNSLAPITSLVSSAKKVNELNCKNEKLDHIFSMISDRTAHLVAFLESYRKVARLPRPTCAEVPWESFVEGIAAQAPFHLVGRLPERPGYFDTVQLERVLLNVLKNAREAGGPKDQIDVRICDEGDMVRIDVLDRGPGMPENVLKQAMLPFFSTKETGTGVGLALSREIIEAHGGDIVISNREGGGLSVSCRIPAAPSPMSRGSITRLTAKRLGAI